MFCWRFHMLCAFVLMCFELEAALVLFIWRKCRIRNQIRGIYIFLSLSKSVHVMNWQFSAFLKTECSAFKNRMRSTWEIKGMLLNVRQRSTFSGIKCSEWREVSCVERPCTTLWDYYRPSLWMRITFLSGLIGAFLMYAETCRLTGSGFDW